MLGITTINYPKESELLWANGYLIERWFNKYPKLFDKDDYRIARSQPRYHFGEWLATIHYFEQGYNVLVEKYIYKTHERKLKILSRYLSPKEISFLKKTKNQPPDLFVYKGRQFFFVEVKKDRDRLSQSQKNVFAKIKNKLGCEVIICYVTLKTPAV